MDRNSDGLGEMFEGDFDDKFLLMLMAGMSGPVKCAQTGSEDPHRRKLKLYNKNKRGWFLTTTLVTGFSWGTYIAQKWIFQIKPIFQSQDYLVFTTLSRDQTNIFPNNKFFLLFTTGCIPAEELKFVMNHLPGKVGTGWILFLTDLLILSGST